MPLVSSSSLSIIILSYPSTDILFALTNNPLHFLALQSSILSPPSSVPSSLGLSLIPFSSSPHPTQYRSPINLTIRLLLPFKFKTHSLISIFLTLTTCPPSIPRSRSLSRQSTQESIITSMAPSRNPMYQQLLMQTLIFLLSIMRS
ncbi:hypothetical protein U1Q18_050411 [Sarracenia purpurea var. burkii]